VGKDKDKKKSGATDDNWAKPSEAPATGDGWNFTEEAEGRLLLITPLESKEVPDNYSKVPGAVKEVIVANIVVIDEKKPEKSEEHLAVWIFQGWLKGALRGFIGERKVVARLRLQKKSEVTKKGNNPAWIFDDPTDKEYALAKAYVESIDPFATGGKAKKSKAEPDEKPAKKKSKK